MHLRTAGNIGETLLINNNLLKMELAMTDNLCLNPVHFDQSKNCLSGSLLSVFIVHL